MRIQEFDYTVDLLQAVLFQYNDAVNLLSLLNQKQVWYNVNQSEFWQNWYDQVFNLATDTPTIFGLAVWAIILDIPLFITLMPEPDDKPIWGFNAYDPSYPTLENTYFNFGQGTFSTRNQSINLTIEEQQFLLRLRYFQLSTLGNVSGIPTSTDSEITTYSINTFLNYLCANNTIGFTGTIYALDELNMTMLYVFTTSDFPYQLLQAILRLDLFPRPAGVQIHTLTLDQQIWGFGENYQNFGNGVFLNLN